MFAVIENSKVINILEAENLMIAQAVNPDKLVVEGVFTIGQNYESAPKLDSMEQRLLDVELALATMLGGGN